VKNDLPPPWSTPSKPLSESRLALVASGGIYVAGQIAFHWNDDLSFRVIDRDTEVSELRATHFAYDLTDARSDPNVVFPLEILRGLVAEGRIGELGPHAYSFMGGIYSSRRVREQLAPALCERLLQDEVDRVLLVPV
jgi:glycine/betaine/sarcosine/D-proline reductase family selenoprotein B